MIPTMGAASDGPRKQELLMKKRPHIIIFNPDEMRWDTMGHMGNPAASTPALDAFAREEAVSFSNAYCQNPVCVPSRCSFFTGLYPHVRGHRTMGYLLRQDEPSLLKELKDAGYYVWANARNDLVAAQMDGLMESHVTELYYGGNAAPAPGPCSAHPRGKPGDPQFYAFCNGELRTDATGRNYTGDDEDVDAAIQRILHPVDDRPLCLFLGLLYPHPAYNIERTYLERIDRSRLPMRIEPDKTWGKSRMLAMLRRYQDLDGMSREQWDELRAIYLAMCAKVDDQFRRLCEALKQAGIYDDSAIFFLSDHGDYAGDYGVVEKAQNCFEDKLTRVPLLIKPPKGAGVDPGVSDSLVELVDFYATVLDYAGVRSSHSQFGRSLAGIVADRSRQVRDIVFCEGGRLAEEKHCSESVNPAVKDGFCFSVMWPRYAAQFDDAAHAKGVMARDREWKYIYRAHGDCELYHLSEDPEERRNCVQEEGFAPICEAMKARILQWYQDTCDVVPFERDARFSKKMIWEKVKNQIPAGMEEEIRARIQAGEGLFQLQEACKQAMKV